MNHMYEIFYSDGGHGGPYHSQREAKKVAKRYVQDFPHTVVAVKRCTRDGYLFIAAIVGKEVKS